MAQASHPATAGARPDPLHVPKAADVVADRIRRQIVRGELVAGQRLPTEGELLLAWQVGRPALREALRILESEGLLKVQRGNVGGAVVQVPSAAAAARAAAVVLQVEQIPLADIYGARLVIETGAARQAATSATPEALAELERLLAVEQSCVEDPRAWALAAVDFHEGVVHAAGLRTLSLFSDMTSQIIDDHQVEIVSEAHSDVDGRRLASRSHAKLLRLVSAGLVQESQEHWHDHISGLNARYFGA
ncbi:MAG: Transcriptional regulator [Frankiales bacterium]|nr:Transcriptional regulator [Frankiales bacterium]